MKYTREQITEVMASKGYKYFTDNNNKSYDVNIIGVRNSDTKGRVTNAFDDTMTISYKCEEGYWHYHEFNCTTDPGSHWVKKILNKKGVAILNDKINIEVIKKQLNFRIKILKSPKKILA